MCVWGLVDPRPTPATKRKAPRTTSLSAAALVPLATMVVQRKRLPLQRSLPLSASVPAEADAGSGLRRLNSVPVWARNAQEDVIFSTHRKQMNG